MAKKGFKARGLKGGNGESNIDWKAIADQVDEGTQSAVITQIIDLGMHTEQMQVSNKGVTGFIDKDDAEEFVEMLYKKYGERHQAFENGKPKVIPANKFTGDTSKVKVLEMGEDGEFEVIKEDADFYVKISEFGGEREYQELAVVVDLVDNPVFYSEAIGEKQYRMVLNNTWKGELKGFPLKKSKPEGNSTVWTVKSNSKLAELAKSTRNNHLLEVDLEEADWSEMLGCGINISVEKKGEDSQYVNAGKTVALKIDRKTKKVEEITEADAPLILITFDDTSVEELEQAHLRKDILDKIKSANDYKGSNIQKAIEAFEALQKRKAKTKAEDDDNQDDDGEYGGQDEVEETPKSSKGRKNKTVEADEVEGGDEGGDNGSENDSNDEDWD